MFLKSLFLAICGFSAGGVIAAGLFAFITVIGVIPRLAGKTHTARFSRLYEDCIVLGAGFGNGVQLFGWRLFGGNPVMAVFGLCAGIFVGCLIMSLAETLDALPVMNRRLKLAVGFQFIILSLALGKCAGALSSVFMGIGIK